MADKASETTLQDPFVDLGLTYTQAMHGVQTAKAMECGEMPHPYGKQVSPNHLKKYSPKHMRTGLDMSKSDMYGLGMLLINKGIITQEEYVEYMRLAANTGLAREEEIHGLTLR